MHLCWCVQVGGLDVMLSEPVSAAQLRRVKRGYLKAATSVTAHTPDHGVQTQSAFVAYLRSNLPGAC